MGGEVQVIASRGVCSKGLIRCLVMHRGTVIEVISTVQEVPMSERRAANMPVASRAVKILFFLSREELYSKSAKRGAQKKGRRGGREKRAGAFAGPRAN